MDGNPRILALDAAGAACSAALWCEGGVRARRFEAMRRGQSERLVPMIEEVMQAGHCRYAELDALAVTLGPGGFTGVRIGLATARALALASAKPLVGVSNFLALAAAARPELPDGASLAVVIDAKRPEVYAQLFDAELVEEGPPACLLPGRLADLLAGRTLLLAGDGVPQVLAALAERGAACRVARASGLCDAGHVAALAAAMALPAANAAPPQPIYLRAPDVIPPVE